MSQRDTSPEFVEFTRPSGHLVAKVVVPSVGQGEAPTIREQVAEQLAATPSGKCFVLDLSSVSLLSSLGLGTCVDLRNTAEKAGLRPVIYGMNRHLTDLFSLMKIDRLFKILKTPQELDQLLGS